MGQVSASSSIQVNATPAKALEALADYDVIRPKILTEQYLDYRVLEGGKGAGTIAQWTLKATEKRSRDVKATVTVAGSTISESDANSSMVTTWTVSPSGDGATVTTTTKWTGASGIGGFFERTFAPLGLKKIQAGVLENLARELA
ncbi:SRPBCC family protein [Tomitella biformata]|uniref:SRPBCC family protein n=1 Tax=Tomitella biformata TaxID=630403 RepID=UPI0004676AE0|nr:SRPBCC family protein [Tomitella biformata]